MSQNKKAFVFALIAGLLTYTGLYAVFGFILENSWWEVRNQFNQTNAKALLQLSSQVIHLLFSGLLITSLYYWVRNSKIGANQKVLITAVLFFCIQLWAVLALYNQIQLPIRLLFLDQCLKFFNILASCLVCGRVYERVLGK